MNSTITKSMVDLNQGQDDKGRSFGYVSGDDGGFFFTWMPTLEDTLASVEADEVDGDGDLDEGEVSTFLAEYLPTTRKGREMWGDTEKVYVVVDASGEYLDSNGERTPCSDRAQEFETRAEAKAACDRITDRVVETDPA